MAAETNIHTESANAAKAQVEAAGETAKAIVDQAESGAKAEAQASPKAARRIRKSAKKSRRKAKPARAKARPAAKERKNAMKFDTNTIFPGFGAFAGTSAFETLFADAAQRGEEAAKRSRKAAEELADLYRGNIEAFVEAGRIATAGAQSIGQDIAAKSRDNLEEAATTVRSFAEAKSPTELLQLQGELARSAFDRFVEESSALTESVVKLAGEAFQPISNRASANVERLNEISA